jgi:Rieske 2Fe-2S family protein
MTEFIRRDVNQKWTDQFKLNHDPISLEDTISPEFFNREMEAIFRRTWLYVGRIERVSAPGSYFTKEFEAIKQSILVTRDKENKLRVYHNVCPHRGNKLVWDTHADRETSGRCKRFVCKFHGIAFGHDGNVDLLTDRVAWLDGQGDAIHLAEVPAEVWNGFIFVNFTPGGPKETLREFLGEKYWAGFDGFDFGARTEWYSLQMNANANWKTLIDGFQEVYHGATTHQLPFAVPPAEKLPVGSGHLVDADVSGRHRYYMTQRHVRGKVGAHFAFERESNAIATGPLYEYPEGFATLPKGANPVGFPDWGVSSNKLWPNLFIQFYYPGWYNTYVMQPLAYNKMRFELNIYFPKSRNFTEMLAQKSCALQFMEAALQDFSLLEAQQMGLETRAFRTYPLTDQEILVRAFHQNIYEAVESYRA